MRAHLVVPAGVGDPARPSGGNAYDRRVRDGLVEHGWQVVEHEVDGRWPHPDVTGRAALATVLAGMPDGSVVVLDGLVACGVPAVVVPEAGRLRLVVLVHLPLGHRAPGSGPGPGTPARALEREGAVLRAAAAVVATSRWTRSWLVDTYALAPDRVRVVTPGADAADLVEGLPAGRRLLCVGAVTPGKGQDLLLDALAAVVDLDWRCRCVGSVEVDPAFVRRLRGRAGTAGLGGRVGFVGAVAGAALDAEYASADLLVAPSRVETYGMVVTEALARGIPVLGARVGGLPEALGRCPDGGVPGLLVPPADTAALAGALRQWLIDPAVRQRLRVRAAGRRSALDDWSVTSDRMAGVLAAVAVVAA